MSSSVKFLSLRKFGLLSVGCSWPSIDISHHHCVGFYEVSDGFVGSAFRSGRKATSRRGRLKKRIALAAR